MKQYCVFDVSHAIQNDLLPLGTKPTIKLVSEMEIDRQQIIVQLIFCDVRM